MAAVMLSAASATPALASEPVCPVDVLDQITGIATFNKDDVNLCKGPSATEGCLCYLGEPETYYQPGRMIWTDELEPIHLANMDILPDYEVIQGHKGWEVAVLGSDGDWAELYYAPHEMWTGKGNVNIKPLVPVTTSTRYMSPNYNALNVTGNGDGAMVVLYQELGREDSEGQGLLFGHIQGNAVVFDAFLPAVALYDPTIGTPAVSQDATGNVVLSYGPSQKVAGLGYEVLNVNDLTEENLNTLLPLAQPLPTNEQHVLIACSDEAVLL